MGTCKECRHWQGNNRHGMTYEMIKEANSAFGCHKAAEFRDDDERMFILEPGNRFISDDGIGVLTGPDFGCIHFEPAEIRGTHRRPSETVVPSVHMLEMHVIAEPGTPRYEMEKLIRKQLDRYYAGGPNPPANPPSAESPS